MVERSMMRYGRYVVVDLTFSSHENVVTTHILAHLHFTQENRSNSKYILEYQHTLEHHARTHRYISHLMQCSLLSLRAVFS